MTPAFLCLHQERCKTGLGNKDISLKSLAGACAASHGCWQKNKIFSFQPLICRRFQISLAFNTYQESFSPSCSFTAMLAKQPRCGPLSGLLNTRRVCSFMLAPSRRHLHPKRVMAFPITINEAVITLALMHDDRSTMRGRDDQIYTTNHKAAHGKRCAILHREQSGLAPAPFGSPSTQLALHDPRILAGGGTV